MVKLATIFLSLALPFEAFAKERPTSFAGIPFGSPYEEAAKVLAARPDVRVGNPAWSGFGGATPGTGRRTLHASGGKFAEVDVETWELLFGGGKLHTGSVLFKRSGEEKTFYRTLRQTLLEKYGTPVRETKTETTWVLPPDLKDKHARTIKLGLSGEAPVRLIISYVDDTLVKESQLKPARPPGPTLTPPKPAPKAPAGDS